MIVVDAHLDLAYNAVEWDRDLRLSAQDTRQLESGMTEKGRATGTVGFPDMRQGGVAIAFGTIFCRVAWPWSGVSGFRTGENGYAHARAQLAYYRQVARNGGVRLIGDLPTLDRHLAEWSPESPAEPPLGIVVTMEGADPILAPEDLASWWRDGLRMLGLAHYGVSAYAHGTGAPGGVRLIGDLPRLERHLAEWSSEPRREPPLGIVVAMEGADPVLAPEDLAFWWRGGLRMLGLAHYGVSAYAHGTGAPGGVLPSAGPLLAEMARLGIVLDVSHLAEQAFYECLGGFEGRVIASHSNCRALVDGDRQLSDDMIRRLVERDGVIGAVMYAWMLKSGWLRGVSANTGLTLEDFVAHVDHVCQIAGDARHAGIGSDLDGGYGTEQCPSDLDTIADVQKVPDLLRARGYSEADVELVMHGNWIRLLRETLPAGPARD